MPNQRAIAAAAGVTQSAVSLALRDDPSIPETTRRHIRETAKQMGYRPNAYVASLMSHIRSGRPPRDKGCIALIAEFASSEKEWRRLCPESHRLQYAGILRRAEELGFHTEFYALDALGMTVSRLDKILFAQGITGIIVLPYGAATGRNLALSWERYAVASISYSWNLLPCDRVSTDHQENVHLACAELLRRGYSRIGICLPPETAAWENRFWPPACLFWQQSLPASQRLPLFTGKPGETPLSDFQAWLKDSRPEVLVTLTAHEKEWLDELGLRIPHDLDLICLNRPFNSIYTGIEENHDTVGATALELVADQVTHNRLGTPARLRRILIAGTWVEGETLKRPPLESVIDLTTQEQRA